MFILSSAVLTDVLLFLANNTQYFFILHVASVCTSCCNLLRVVGSCCAKFETCQTFECQNQLPTRLLFRDRRSEAQKCWIRFAQFFLPCWGHTRASHMVYLDFTKSYGLYSSHDALERPTLLEMKEI